MALTKVKKIGKYEILDVLGRGGMGVVYKATDPAIGRLVAIKMITSGHAEDPDFLRRFYREAKSTGKLQHHNIVIVHELGDEDGTPFLVMEFLEGESLQSIINARRQVPLLDKLNYMVQTCTGLHYAHQRNVVHRDIKPANLMVLKDGTIKIVDFGIARIESENVTLPGQVVGSIHYMSPEQINGFSVDCRTDIFSTGVVLYQLLTYTLPFEGKDTGSTLLKIINEPPPPLQNFLKVYPPDLDNIVQRALAKLRDERYPTAEDFAFDLSQVQDQLKRELVSEYLQVAEDLLARSELGKAKEQVFQILRVDRQNRRASDLLKEIQRLIQNQQRSEQARQLRANAEEAIAAQQLDRALEYLDQAVSLDSQNAELQQFRQQTRDAKVRLQKIQDAIRRAESAQWAGELDVALAAAEEALALDPNDIEAKALRNAIAQEIRERNRHQQIQELLDTAQRHISSRQFTDAIEALQKAEVLDPSAPAIKDMMTLAATGREQERRRKEIDQLTAEIQEALNRDDYGTACEKADGAVQRYPSERGLLKLKAMAERQRLAGEKRRFIDEQITRARKLLEARQTEQALETLEAACKRFPTEPALLSLLTAVRENLQQERAEARKNEYIQRAKEALRRKEYQQATDILETARAELEAPEIDDLLQFAKDEAAAHAKRQMVDSAAQEAHRLISAEEFERAIEFLKGILQEIPDEELEILRADAQRQLDDFNRRVKDAVETAERLLRAERVVEAVRYLESQADSCGKSGEFVAVMERARREQERMRAIAAAVQSARTALSGQDFTTAADAIERCRQCVGDHDDLTQMAAEIEARRREAATKAVSKAVADSRMLLLGQSYDSAVHMLDEVFPFIDLAPGDVRTRYLALREEAVRGLERVRNETASRPAHPPHGDAEDEDTAQQVEWTAPATGTAATFAQNRERDLQELTQLAHESDTVTNWAALEGVSQRARLIAKRHPGDSDIQTLAGNVANAADSRARDLVADAEIVTPTPPPLEVTENLAPRPSSPAVLQQPSLSSAPAAQSASTGKTPGVAEPGRTAWPEMPPGAETIVIPKPETGGRPVGIQLDATARSLEPATEPEPGRPTLVLARARKRDRQRRRLLIAGVVAVPIILALIVWRMIREAPAVAAPVVVHTTPEGATVRVKDALCITPNCNLKLAPGTYNVDVSLRGYAPGAATVVVEKGHTPPAVNMALQALPLMLRVNSNFNEGRVWLDNRPAGSLQNGQLTLDHVQPGTHTLKAAGPDGEGELTFSANPARVPVPSSPVRGSNIFVLAVSSLAGSTRLDCNCAGPLKLAIDGRASGELSAAGRDLGELGEGVHELALGAGDDVRTLSVRLGAAPALEAFFNAERNTGTLVVESDVDNADVFVNDKHYQRITGGTLRIPLEVNNYTVRVQKPGYLPAPPQSANIQKNHETRVTFNLTPREQKAFLALRGGVPGAQVSIDGKSIGTVDSAGRFRSPAVEPGQHVVQIDKDGYQSRTIKVALKSGETRDLNSDEVLMTKAAPPPSPAVESPPPRASNNSTPTPSVDPAQRDWERIRNVSDTAALEGYITKYPGSPYAAEASRKLEQLDWDRVRNSNDPAQLQAFLDKHPGSQFATAAHTSIEKFTRARAETEGVQADRKAVLQVINAYASAFQQKNVDKIVSLYPGLDKQQVKKLRDVFKAAQSVRMELQPDGDPQIHNDSASVVCHRTSQYTYPEGIQKPADDTVTIQLRKKGSSWVMESIQ
jgi:serine/threonine-protein kinase